MIRFTNGKSRAASRRRAKTIRFATGIAVTMLALGSGAVLSGCKSDDAAPAPAKSSAEPAKEAAPAKAEPPKGVAPPAGSKLSKVTNGMTDDEVQQIMGAPSGRAFYPSANRFTPWGRWTQDTGDRTEYKYKGQGRVVFAEQRYKGGQLAVIRVDYDPAEDGK